MNENVRKTEKKNLRSRAVTLSLLFVALVFSVIYVIALNSSLGWFASHPYATADGMQVAVANDKYEILVEHTYEYDTLLEGSVFKYDDMDAFESKLEGSGYGYDLSATALATTTGIAFELRNEVAYHDAGIDYRFLMPGSCGTLTFYLRPLVSEDITAHFTISTEYFKKIYDSQQNMTIQQGNDPLVSDLLKGHLLLFTERTGTSVQNYKYNGLVDSDSLEFSTSEHSLCTTPGKTDCYELTPYWEWPPLYSEIANNISATTWEKKYPANLRTYIDAHRSYFFANNQSSSVLEDLIDAYNDADQTIGDHANYVTVEIQFN